MKHVLHFLLLLLISANQSCIMVNRGVQEIRTIPFVVLGIGLIYLALKLAWRNAGQTEVPAWLRFSLGLVAGIILFVA